MGKASANGVAWMRETRAAESVFGAMRCLLLLFVCLAPPAVWAERLKAVEPTFTPDEREGLIYGRMEFVFNGQVLPPDAKGTLFLKPKVRSGISKFVGLDKLNTSGWSASDYLLDSFVSERGFFAVRLPVGRYYFVDFTYTGAAPGPASMASWRTYTELLSSTVRKPMVISFEVLPGKATYLGTIRHFLSLGRLRINSQEFFFDLQFSDEYKEATNVLLQHMPGLMVPTISSPYHVDMLAAPVR